MAIYISKDGSGGDGSEGNPYNLSEIGTAETAAASQADRTIIFKNGTYALAASLQLQRLVAIYTGMIYEAETTGGVIFDFGNTYGIAVGDVGTVGNTTPAGGFTGTVYIRGIHFKHPKATGGNLGGGYAAWKACVNLLHDVNVSVSTGMIHLEDCAFTFANPSNTGDSPIFGSYNSGSMATAYTLNRCTITVSGATGGYGIIFGNPGSASTVRLYNCSTYFTSTFNWGSPSASGNYVLGSNLQTSRNSSLEVTNCIFQISSGSVAYTSPNIGLGPWAWEAGDYLRWKINNINAHNLFAGDKTTPLTAFDSKNLTVDDPQFVSPENLDLRLRPDSPLIGTAV